MPGRKKEAETGKSRNIVTVPLTAGTNRLINGWCDRMGGSKTGFVVRLLEFWAAAPDSVRQLMVGVLPADLVDEVIERASDYFKEVAERSRGGRPEISESGEPGDGTARKSSRQGESSASRGGAGRGEPPAPEDPPSRPRGRPR